MANPAPAGVATPSTPARTGAVGNPAQTTTPARGGIVATASSYGKMGVQATAETMTMNLEGHIAHIERAQEELRKFAAETRRPGPAPWPFAIGGMIVGAALFGAGMGFMKLVGS